MSDEIKYIDAGDTGLTLEARISQAGVQIGSNVSMTESGTLGGHYYADFPSANTAGAYIIEIFDGSTLKGDAVEFYWDGSNEVNLLYVYDLLKLTRDHARASNLQTQEQGS